MPLAPDAVLAMLRERHLAGLSRRQLQVLALCQYGYPVQDIAAMLGIAAPTVRRHLAELEARIFDVTGLCPSHLLLARWTREHEDCCARPIFQVIRDRQLLDRCDQRRARPA